MALTYHITTAVIPLAGLGTRCRPASFAVPKALMPLPDGDGGLRPVLHFILSEAAAAGIRQAVLVVSPQHERMLVQYVQAAQAAGYTDVPEQIEFLPQAQPTGFGHAVLSARPIVEDRPFVAYLGDHVRLPGPAGPATKQVVAAFEKQKARAVIGMQVIGPDDLPRMGVARGWPTEQEGLYHCADLIEKPDEPTARRRLVTPGLPKGQYLAHAGVYAFDPMVFDLLEAQAERQLPAGMEVQLTDAQIMLLERHPSDYYLQRIDGQVFDTGVPAGFAAAVAAFAAAGEPGR